MSIYNMHAYICMQLYNSKLYIRLNYNGRVDWISIGYVIIPEFKFYHSPCMQLKYMHAYAWAVIKAYTSKLKRARCMDTCACMHANHSMMAGGLFTRTCMHACMQFSRSIAAFLSMHACMHLYHDCTRNVYTRGLHCMYVHACIYIGTYALYTSPSRPVNQSFGLLETFR